MKKIIISFACVLCITISVRAQIIFTVAGNGTAAYSGDGGQATNAEINNPKFIIVDSKGALYIGDYYNNVIRKVSKSGVINTIAGTGTASFSGDGGQATNATLNDPLGMVVDTGGNIYIADELNNRIRKIDPSGIITTYAGNGTQGYSGDGGLATAAEFNWPDGLALDAYGNLYIGDYNNQRVRIINKSSGIITTIAGNGTGGFSGDGGPATNAELNLLHGVALDDSGNVFIADSYNYRIRKVDTKGIITTCAGNGIAGYSGDGGPATSAELNVPTGVTIVNGHVYIGDYANSRVRVVSPTGTISTIAGNGTAGFSGDWGPPTLAELNYAFSVVRDAAGSIYIADDGNNRVREINLGEQGINELANNNSIMLYPNPADDKLSLVLNKIYRTILLQINTITGQQVISQSFYNKQSIIISTTELPSGIYILTLQTEDVSKVERKLEIAR
ncbi:MAG TPA: T9SS type A sorting domain-containing protein [Bacteroidia bacterium]|jgi:hypothetical protein|nr:T9SS type A sorting domain-containing protein [Bacteroidia bacterium]